MAPKQQPKSQYERVKAPKPTPSNKEIRRQLGQDLIEMARNQQLGRAI